MGEAEERVKHSRKRKEKVETDNSEAPPEKKAKDFCCRTFRQELRGSEVLKSLKRFISATKNSDDVVQEYLDCGGSLQEILSVIDVTASEDLTTALPVFETVHLILLRCQSVDSKHHEKCIEAARNILRTHMLTIKAMLSMAVPKHKKVALKLLTAIATLDSSFANEIMNVVALSPTLITDLTQPSPEKESVRKSFILFILSFLIEGNLTVVRTLLDKKGFLSSIIPGLKFDEATTVNLTLSLFEDKILKNTKITKTFKLKVFNTQIIKSLFDLYEWKGPQGVNQVSFRRKNRVKEVEINPEEKEIVTESVHSFLLLLCCSQKYGVAFHDKSLGTSDQLNNQLLLTVFESLPDPLKSKKVSEVLLKTIVSCPDLMRPVLLKLEPSFQPRNSKNWFQAMDFAESLVKAVDVTEVLKSEPVTANELIKVGKTLYGPVTLLKVSRIGSQKTEAMEIRSQSLSLLTTIWRKTQQLIDAFQEFRAELKKSLHKHILKSVLEAEDLLELWHTLCNAEYLSSVPLSNEKKVQFLSAVLESFHITLECQRSAVSSPLGLAADLLRHVELIKDSVGAGEFERIQVKIVELVQVDIQSLTPSMELFEKSLRILLRSADESSLGHSSKILASLNVFRRNNAEVDVWLQSYMSIAREHRPSVADDLIRSLRAAVEEEEVESSEGSNEGLLTPFIFSCVQLLKSSKPSKTEKSANFRQYINDVVIHLQFFYGVDECLHDRLREFTKVLEKSTLDFLKSWKSSRWTFANVLRCPAERDLVSWIADGESDRRNAREVIRPESTNLLGLFSLFRIVVAYLTKRSADGELTDVDAEKLTEALSLFLSHPPEDDGVDVGLVSSDVKNTAVFQRRCLECLLRSKHLLGEFDVFQRKETASRRTTAVVLGVLVEKDVMKSAAVKRTLTEEWKRRFLKQLKLKLKKSKSIEGLALLGKALDFFDYDSADVTEVMELLVSVAELDLFANGNRPSAWTKVLSKFMELHCEGGEFDGDTVRRLCSIMKYLSERCPDVEEMSDCFVRLLRKHPSQLLLIDNEFLEVILERGSLTPGTFTLGRLLLNDPGKVRHFLEILPGKLGTSDPRTAFSLLSTLIASEDSLPDGKSDGESRSVWKMSEITPETTPELYDILKAVYKKYEKDILQAVTGEKTEVIAENLTFTRQLMKLFLEKKKVVKMKKEILKGKLEPKLLCEAVKKGEESGVAESCLKGLLRVFCWVIRSEEEGVDWEEYCGVVSEVLLVNEAEWEVAGLPEWKEFAKLAVGRCFALGRDAPLLRIFRQLIAAFYKPEESEDCALFFQMLIAHSQFLKVMLSDSPLKAECVHLFHSLIQRCPSQASPKHFPILLAAYSAGLSPHDTALLEVLRLYEKTGVAVSSYEPFVWGDTAVSHYSIGTSSGLSLWQRFNMRNVLDLLDGNRLELSLKEFPIRRGLGGTNSAECDANVYDPAFLLPLFVNLLSPGAVVYSLAFIYKGGLAYTVRAMSSECKDVRLTASVVLTRFYSHLELSQNLKQKLVWMHFINRLRYGVTDLSARPLPNITTLFLSRMTLELSRHPAEMYPPLQNFLLARSYFSFDGVPEFLPLFHSSETSYWKHREWLLEVLRDGTKTSLDMSLVFHSMALKVIFCFYHSQLCDVETKKLILQVLERMLRVGRSVLLISEYGLLSWINTMELGLCQPVAPDLLGLLATLTGVILNDIRFHKNKHSNLCHLIQMLNVAVRLLPSVRSLKSAEVFGVYLKIIKECLMFFAEEGESDWFKLNRDRLDDIMDAGSVILGEEYDCRRFRKVPFYFRDFNESCSGGIGEELKKCVFLFDKLAENKRNKTES